ncbi:helix-turn-helix transcriptional regulator [Persicobacter diffluens]|uniref:HTH cro/C1-type domain-containing protein n=1 Tax=Persicobacter diffluens TaxID=981 RepID=A0AAN5AM24_9BACT|nr:hypothetical protein PEDI_51670 [Persicobacter diffluens]
MKINQLIKKLRYDNDLTQNELAELFDLNPETVKRWEQGRSFPTFIKLIAILKHFGKEYDIDYTDLDPDKTED